ncbi:BON domain-containing protein [Solimonas soli]|uniref:BON domain-containing protein n=1 Tax=Solimonas soli TaxID=413479 RepID=UPI00047F6583|nr:BON domain-containing protein [Solimonas soli]
MRTDMQIRKDVLDELEWDPAIDAAGVGVEVRNGVVTLSGHLRSYPEKLAAERAAQRVSGVKAVAVEADVRISDGKARSDSDLALAASDALRWNALVPEDSVKVLVEDGRLTLSGQVPWAYQRSAAESAVRDLLGVVSVNNQVTVRPKASAGNVKGKIEAALHRAARLDAQAITISVDSGRVTLDGTVHSLAERRLVEEAAWSATGVSAVVDRLQIVD